MGSNGGAMKRFRLVIADLWLGCCVALALLVQLPTDAAPVSGKLEVAPPAAILTGPYRDRAIRALRQPLSERLVMIKTLGEKGIATLKELAFDNQESLETRWRATTALGQVWPKEALPVLEKALSSDEWFMRNAAMIALTHGSRAKALEWSEKLLDDKALVVRTAAVQAADRINAKELSEKLWARLHAKENFRNNQSLWIRKHIVRTLSKFGRPDDTPKFISLLRTNDSELHPYAVKGLERATGQVLGGNKTTTYWKKEKWLSWWRDNKKSASN